jgi:RNA polymerase sigma-70 factor (ECF subfamily)
MQKTENEIILNCQKGKTEDFGLLYDLYVKKIYSYFFFRTSSKEISEDLTSICFTKAFEKIHQVDPKKGAFRSWLYQIAKNTLVDYFRSHKATAELSETENLKSKDNPFSYIQQDYVII